MCSMTVIILDWVGRSFIEGFMLFKSMKRTGYAKELTSRKYKALVIYNYLKAEEAIMK